MEKLSAKTGLSIESMQEWNYVAKMHGTEIGALAPAFKTLSKNVAAAADGNKAMAKEFKSMGIDTKDAAGHLRGIDEVTDDVIRKLADMSNHTRQVAEANQLLGKGASALLPIIAKGSEEFHKQKQEAQDLGLVLSEDLIARGVEAEDTMQRLKMVIKALEFKAMTDLIGPFTDALTIVITDLAILEEMFSRSGEAAEEATHGMTIFQQIVMGVGDVVLLFGVGLKSTYEILKTLGQFIGTTFAEGILIAGQAFDTLQASLDMISKTAGAAFDALAHPSKAVESVKKIEEAFEQYKQQLLVIKDVTKSVSGDIWHEFGKNAKDNVETVQESMENASKALDALRLRLATPMKHEKKKEGPDPEDPVVHDDSAIKAAQAAAQTLQDVRLKSLQEGAQSLEEQEQIEQLILADSYAQKLETVKTNSAAMNAYTQAYGIESVQMHKKFEDQRSQATADAIAARAKMTSLNVHAGISLLGTLSSALERSAARDKTHRLEYKAAAISQALAAGAVATMESYRNAGGYPWGIVPALAMGAATALQVETIREQQFIDGGFPVGQNARVRMNEDGRQEAVLNARATAFMGRDTINQLNKTGSMDAQKPQVNIIIHGSQYDLRGDAPQNLVEQLKNMEQSQRIETLRQLKDAMLQADYYRA